MSLLAVILGVNKDVASQIAQNTLFISKYMLATAVCECDWPDIPQTPIIAACETNSIDLIEYVVDGMRFMRSECIHHALVNTVHKTILHIQLTTFCEVKYNYKHSESTLDVLSTIAAAGGYMKTMEYLTSKHKIIILNSCMHVAAYSGQIEMIDYLIEHHSTDPDILPRIASATDNVELCEYLHSKNLLKYTAELTTLAVEHSASNSLDWLLAHNCPLDDEIDIAIAIRPNYVMCKQLLSHGVQFRSDAIEILRRNKNYAIIELVVLMA